MRKGLVRINKNVAYFDRIWEEEEDGKGGLPKVSRASWDNRAEEFNRHDQDERRDKIIDLLLEKGMLQENSTVLDIGCGPGKFVLEFAARAKTVVGVDISPKMLQYAAENVSALSLTNTELKELDWEKADLSALHWQKKFSLVTGIMSPAFYTRRSLEKMLEASKEYCLICHFVKRNDSIGDALKKEVLGRNTVDEFGNKALYCSLNILWLYQLFPEVVYFHTDKEITRSLEEAGRHYISRLEMKRVLTEEQKKEVLSFLKNQAQNGVIRERTTAKIACIYWRNK